MIILQIRRLLYASQKKKKDVFYIRKMAKM